MPMPYPLSAPMLAGLRALAAARRLERFALGFGAGGQMLVANQTMDGLAARRLARVVKVRPTWRARCIGWARVTEEGERLLAIVDAWERIDA